MENKTCKYCKQEVPKDAVKCSYCREWLNKTELSIKNPLFGPVVVIILFLGITKAITYFAMKDISFVTEKFSSKSKIQILSHQLVKEKDTFRIVGEIHNGEKFKWDSVEILVILDPADKSKFALLSDYVGSIEPGETKKFQVDSTCSGSVTNQFKNYEIKIENASAYFRK